MKPFFSENSPYLHHPMLTPERTEAEVDFIVQHLNVPEQGRILDVGCAFGRHTIALAQRGFDSVGIDPAPAMIAAAQTRATAAGVSPRFEVMDATALPFVDEFDGAICLFTTFGQIREGQDNVLLLKSVRQILKPEGRFIIEVPNKDWLVENLKPEDRFGGQETYTHVTRQFDPTASRITETFEVVSPGQQETFLLQYKIFTQKELIAHLTAVRFAILDLYANYQEEPLLPDSPTLIVVAQL